MKRPLAIFSSLSHQAAEVRMPISIAHWEAFPLLSLPLLGVMEVYKRVRARALEGGREK